MPFNTGRVINGRYRVVRLLAEGGFGAVYKAWDLDINGPCALKHNLDSSEEAQRQFEREAQTLSDVNHPNLPRVTDKFFVPGQGQFLVMDFVDGVDLQTMVEQGPISEEKALGWIGQIADALTYLHDRSQPIIHRDIKPANIRITPQGQAILVDFGLVKVYDEHLKTTMGARAVTPGYSPPEQYGQGNTDARTDIYALSATLYTLLTGQEPQESVLRIVGDKVVPARKAKPAISIKTSAAISTGMALRPTERYQQVSDLKVALLDPEPVLKVSVPQTKIPSSQLSRSTTTPLRPVVSGARSSNVKEPGWLIGRVVVGVVVITMLALIYYESLYGNPVEVVTVREVVVTRLATVTPSNTMRVVEYAATMPTKLLLDNNLWQHQLYLWPKKW